MKLLHLVGFIIKKFVTMHGHMNVKKVTAVLMSGHENRIGECDTRNVVSNIQIYENIQSNTTLCLAGIIDIYISQLRVSVRFYGAIFRLSF